MLCHVLMLIILLFFVVDLCAPIAASDYAAAYPFLCYSVARSAGGLSTFSCVVPLSIVSEALHLPLWLQVTTARAYRFLSALQLPKPMFEFAFEGELLAFIVNGDRFVLLALLPRRKPRTDGSVQPPYHSVKELNLTSSRLLRFACPIWRLAWISVSLRVGTPLYTIPAKTLLGFTGQKKEPPLRMAL